MSLTYQFERHHKETSVVLNELVNIFENTIQYKFYCVPQGDFLTLIYSGLMIKS